MQQIELTEQGTYNIINSKQENYQLVFNYNQAVQGWFLDLVSENFKIYGIRVTSVLNILKQWSDKIGFGVAVKCEQDSEPMFFEDFTTKRARVYLLEPDDLITQKVLWKNINLIDNI